MKPGSAEMTLKLLFASPIFAFVSACLGSFLWKGMLDFAAAVMPVNFFVSLEHWLTPFVSNDNWRGSLIVDLPFCVLAFVVLIALLPVRMKTTGWISIFVTLSFPLSIVFGFSAVPISRPITFFLLGLLCGIALIRIYALDRKSLRRSSQ